MHAVLGHVEVHEDLLEDDLPLGVDLVGAQGRRREHVGEDVEPDIARACGTRA